MIRNLEQSLLDKISKEAQRNENGKLEGLFTF